MAQRNFQWGHDESKWTKIVIPSGTVDPNQSTVIQIPEDLQHSEVVIARNPGAAGQSGGGGGVGGGYGGGGVAGNGGGGGRFPTANRGQIGPMTQQDNFAPPYQPTGNQPPLNGQKAQIAPGPGGEAVGEDNMLALTTPNEAEILKFERECDEERSRLLVMPINKKMRMMEQMEYIETGVVRKDLKEFQETRRKLVFDLQSIFATLPNVKQTVKGIVKGKP